MTPEELMAVAADLGAQSVRQGWGGPFGAVIASDGRILATGQNRVLQTGDPTVHAEMDAIRSAAAALSPATLELIERPAGSDDPAPQRSRMLSGYEILTRYLFPQHAPDWGEEVIVYVVMWGVFMSGSGLVGDNHHVRADIIVRMLGEQQQRLCEIFNTLLGIGFTGAMAWFGWEVVEFALMLDERSISSLRFPIAWYYLCLPVGMGLMALRFTIRLYELLFRFDPARHTLREDDFSHD